MLTVIRGGFLKLKWSCELHWKLRLSNKLCTDTGNKLCNFFGVDGVCGAWCFGMKKGLRNSEGLYIHDGGDEGDRTPDLLTYSISTKKLIYIYFVKVYETLSS